MNSVSSSTNSTRPPLTPDQTAQVAKMAARDREVRAHEAAHLSAAGGLARGGASFSYEQGPDGKIYAVGGEVKIDTTAGRTPQETLAKARQIRAAATAPADPSGADLAVAARASQLEASATRQLMQGHDTSDAAAARASAAYGQKASAGAMLDGLA